MLKKYNKQLSIIYVIILALYPLFRVGQGLSVMDTTYSAANFRFFHDMNGTWMVATYFANILGSIFVELPGGSTLLGLNIYTSLVVSLTAVSAFIYLKREIPESLLFIGEIIALGLCWCPTTILYNYLTYLLFTVGALTLYRAVCGARVDTFVAAGILLGLNVGTRFPNITEAALILAVWYVAVIEHKKFSQIVKETLMCIGGYLIGFVMVIILITIRYDAAAFPNMIKTLFAMTDKATDYKPTSMIGAMFGDYLYAGKWLVLIALGFVVCIFINWITTRVIKGKAQNIIGFAGCIIEMLLVLRICYGQGMFCLNYYEYRSVYFIAVAFILLATIMSLVLLFVPEKNDSITFHRMKIMSAFVLIIIYITCLGSNNGLYPIVNNLFVVAPFVLWITYETCVAVIKDGKLSIIRSVRYAIAFVSIFIAALLLIQSIPFHIQFALQDGDDGTKRSAYVNDYSVTKHIATTESNAKNLDGLMVYIDEYVSDDTELILYGNIPGLGFVLDRESALSTFWADLDSYTYDEWDRDLLQVSGEIASGLIPPVIITSTQVAAWESQNEEAIAFWGINEEKFANDKKLSDLIHFIHQYEYEQVFCNDGYSVYMIK